MTSMSKSLAVYAVGLVAVWVLMPLAWAGARIGFDALAGAQDRQLSQQVAELLQRNGVAAADVPETFYGRVEKAKAIPAAQQDLEGILKGRVVTRMSWFGVALIVSVVVFGIVSVVCCTIAMDAALVGVIPVAYFLIRDPILHFRLEDKLDSSLQSVILLAAQVVVCYLFGAVAASSATKRNTERWKRSGRR